MVHPQYNSWDMNNALYSTGPPKETNNLPVELSIDIYTIFVYSIIFTTRTNNRLEITMHGSYRFIIITLVLWLKVGWFLTINP